MNADDSPKFAPVNPREKKALKGLQKAVQAFKEAHRKDEAQINQNNTPVLVVPKDTADRLIATLGEGYQKVRIIVTPNLYLDQPLAFENMQEFKGYVEGLGNDVDGKGIMPPEKASTP
jgi:hypothetical protein